MFQSIVVPVDLAERDLLEPALSQAVAMARQSGGRLTLVNVVPVIPVTMADTMPVSYEADLADRATDDLAALARTIDLPPERVQTVSRIGGIQQEVVDVATEVGADLIVVGSHQPALATYLIGSNATSIVRHATCSVLVLRPPADSGSRGATPA